jgi:hypothetical protein
MLVNFDARYLHIMVLGIYECHENEDRKGHSFLMDVNEVTFTCAP